jgi:hypothetical protein
VSNSEMKKQIFIHYNSRPHSFENSRPKSKVKTKHMLFTLTLNGLAVGIIISLCLQLYYCLLVE